MTIFAVEWSPIDDYSIVALCTSESLAREIFEAFTPKSGEYGWLYLNAYEADVLLSWNKPPQRLAERELN